MILRQAMMDLIHNLDYLQQGQMFVSQAMTNCFVYGGFPAIQGSTVVPDARNDARRSQYNLPNHERLSSGAGLLHQMCDTSFRCTSGTGGYGGPAVIRREKQSPLRSHITGPTNPSHNNKRHRGGMRIATAFDMDTMRRLNDPSSCNLIMCGRASPAHPPIVLPQSFD